ncbi:unnamed protein product [Closterium sp. NIES-54]
MYPLHAPPRPSRVPPPTVLLLSPPLSLAVSSTPFAGSLCATRSTVSRVLSFFVTELIAPLPPVSALVADLASTHCLDYATRLISAPARPPSVRDDLEGTQYKTVFLADSDPHLRAMPLAP